LKNQSENPGSISKVELTVSATKVQTVQIAACDLAVNISRYLIYITNIIGLHLPEYNTKFLPDRIEMRVPVGWFERIQLKSCNL
jgi:hypothetical protein